MATVRNNLGTLVEDFERHPRDLAIVAPRGLRHERMRYKDLAHLARRFAAELERRSIARSERVLLWGENSAEWVGAFFGCVLRGVLPVPLDTTSTVDFARRVISDVSPQLVVADRGKISQLATNLPVLALEDLAANISPQRDSSHIVLSAADPLQIIFTSGTTGEPKGIVHTHGNVLSSLAPIEREMQKYLPYERLFHPLRFLHTLPLSHVFGQFMGLWLPPLLAAEVHFQSRLVASGLVVQIRRERISVLATVPRVLELLRTWLLETIPNFEARLNIAKTKKMWRRWWDFRDVHRLFGWKFWAFISGGAALPADTERFWNTLGFAVVQGYGMTETTALITLNHPLKAAHGTVGRVLPGREVKLADDGEVLVRGASIANSIWQHGGFHANEEEWLRTGDVADFDASGNLQFRGRKKDVIITAAGLNIYPEDLEKALLRQTAIRDAAVIETDSKHGPEPLAVVIPVTGNDSAAAIAAANSELADFQQIRHWLVWPDPALPRTSTGKLMRREISRRIAADEIAPAPRLNGGEDLQLDSLGRVELQARLEQQYGVLVSDQKLEDVKTTADLDRLVREASPAGAATYKDPHNYPRWPWNPIQQFVRAIFLETIGFPFVWFLAAPRVQRSRLPASGPLLIVANHVTSYDAPLVLYALPRRLRHRVAIAMSGEMLLDMRRARNQGNWFLNVLGPAGYLLITALFNVFPLPRSAGFRTSFGHAGEAVDRGYSVLVFPEGQRSEDGRPQPFKTGSGLLWKELAVPALPVHLSGLGELKLRRKGWFRSGRIEVIAGERLLPEPHRTPDELTGILRDAVIGLAEHHASGDLKD